MSTANQPQNLIRLCKLPYLPVRPVPHEIESPFEGARTRFVVEFNNKWGNGTELHYYFFDKKEDGRIQAGKFNPWKGDPRDIAIVEQGFQTWMKYANIKFTRVNNPEAAEIRIGFEQNDGSWSYVGRDLVDLKHEDARTTNFGWPLYQDAYGLTTAIHEIGHILGLQHEHQNPKAGIEWDQNAVYKSLSGPPNYWDKQSIDHNILDKIPSNKIELGSVWDPNSIMEYSFEPGLIKKPENFKKGVFPPGILSDTDILYIQNLYPRTSKEIPLLEPSLSSKLNLKNGESAEFLIKPKKTSYFTFQTFGLADMVMFLYKKSGDSWVFRTSNDSSKADPNNRDAKFRIKLFLDEVYLLRLRLYYADQPEDLSVMFYRSVS